MFKLDFYAVGIELLKGIGLFFLHPLTYILILFSLFLGYKRVQRERKDFHTRVYDIIDDWLSPLFPSFIAALVLMLVVVGLGIVIPLGVMLLFAAVHLLLLLTGQARWLSPAYTGSLTLLFALIFPNFKTGSALINQWISEIHSVHLPSIAVLVGLLMITEAVLILSNGANHTSPKLFTSKRGKTVGGHEAQRVWILPVFLLIPSGTISIVEFWPIIPTDYSQLGFMAVPFAVGFKQVVCSTLPKEAIFKYGRLVLLVGVTVLGLSTLSMFYPIFIPIVAVTALLTRELISIIQKLREDNKTNIYAQQQNGLVILGVIPQSPAEKMEVKVGEVVTKVNGIRVETAQQCYEALQQNSAFCKLEIINLSGELRFTQTSLYDGEHHQVGMLFVKQDNSYYEEAI